MLFTSVWGIKKLLENGGRIRGVFGGGEQRRFCPIPYSRKVPPGPPRPSPTQIRGIPPFTFHPLREILYTPLQLHHAEHMPGAVRALEGGAPSSVRTRPSTQTLSPLNPENDLIFSRWENIYTYLCIYSYNCAHYGFLTDILSDFSFAYFFCDYFFG